MNGTVVHGRRPVNDTLARVAGPASGDDGCSGHAELVGGTYINGGICPLVGGKLARAAFEHGRERLGVETLRR